ncbi:MAG: reverse transcriptase family protein [Muribaculaceae bacterium]|nr:reverse transcriptase family protein [Muribaculaceae bacterium]
MDKDTLISRARALETPKDFLNLMNEIKADLLGDKSFPFSVRQLHILCNPKNEKKRYVSFEIPKKSGGSRQICAPSGNLKWFQICLNELFKALYTPSPYAMGFTIGKSIVDNARMHTNQNYVFNIDLKDFFPSIDQARVWKRLQLAPFNFNPKIAGLIAGLCSIKSVRYSDSGAFSECYVLPQGAPTSPLLTNAICDTLDRRLYGLAKRFGLHYSRYADDITFSSMHNVYHPDGDFRKELERIITDQRFTINAKKTRLQHCSVRQEVTGITVGQKLNVARKYVKDVRAILHIWEKYGINAAYATFYPRYKSEKCQLHRGEPNLINVISGKLCYLKMVKGENDPVYAKLFSQFTRLTSTEKPVAKPKDIDYLFTMPLIAFEKKLGCKLEYRTRTHDNKPYACFYFQGRFFVVGVSKNLDINNLPGNVEISLTRMAVPLSFYVAEGNPIPKIKPTKPQVGYLLHKHYSGKKRKEEIAAIAFNQSSDVPDSLREFVLSLAEHFPELQLRDDMGIIESQQETDLLSRLVDSNFDLSILP